MIDHLCSSQFLFHKVEFLRSTCLRSLSRYFVRKRQKGFEHCSDGWKMNPFLSQTWVPCQPSLRPIREHVHPSKQARYPNVRLHEDADDELNFEFLEELFCRARCYFAP